MLEKIAASLLIAFIAVVLVFSLVLPKWVFIKSPNTGICYEERITFFVINMNQSISQVASSYCEDKK